MTFEELIREVLVWASAADRQSQVPRVVKVEADKRLRDVAKHLREKPSQGGTG